jgi:hypothetical protein
MLVKSKSKFTIAPAGVVAPVAVQVPLHIIQEPVNSYSKSQFIESTA